MAKLLSERGIPHCFTGHPSMGGLFFSENAPTNYRDWLNTDYSFYDSMAEKLIDRGVLCEPDSREPWFIAEAHDDECLAHTLEQFELAIDETLAEEGAARQTGS